MIGGVTRMEMNLASIRSDHRVALGKPADVRVYKETGINAVSVLETGLICPMMAYDAKGCLR